ARSDGSFRIPVSTWLDVDTLGTLTGDARMRLDAATSISDSFAMLGVAFNIGEMEMEGAATSGSTLRIDALPTAGAGPLSQSNHDVSSDSKWGCSTRRPISATFGLKVAYDNEFSGQHYTVTLTADAMDVARDDQQLQVIGHASMSGRSVRITGKSAQLGLRQTTSSFGSGYRTEVSVHDLVPDSGPSSLSVESLRSGVITRYSLFKSGLRFLLGTGFVSGALEEDEHVNIMVQDGAGAVRVPNVLVGYPDGYFTRTMDGVDWTPGDKLFIDNGQGDPDIYVIPQISAHYDLDHQALTGKTSPGTRVIVTVRGGNSLLPRALIVVADNNGRFTASVGEYVVPGIPLFGTAEVESAVRYKTYVTWAQPWLKYRLGESAISMSSAIGIDSELSMTSPDGRTVSPDPVHMWNVDIIDNATLSTIGVEMSDAKDGPMLIVPDNRIQLAAAGVDYSWTVPRIASRLLDGRLHITSSMPIVKGALCATANDYTSRDCIIGTAITSQEVEFALGETGIPTPDATVELTGETQTVSLALRVPLLTVHYDRGIVELSPPPIQDGYRLVVSRQGLRVSDNTLSTKLYGALFVNADIHFGDLLEVVDAGVSLLLRLWHACVSTASMESEYPDGLKAQLWWPFKAYGPWTSTALCQGFGKPSSNSPTTGWTIRDISR
ncbi:MAG: hypothetical protein U0361_00170, partial [Nitrospiraceae bacterium]